MKKKTRIGILAAALVLLVAAGVFVGVNYTLVSGKLVSRRAETIDLRGKNITAKQLTKARKKLPDAHILWDIAIGGKTFDGESENIVTADFTAGDIPAFARLENLASADVSACSDISAILALRAALPEVRVFWTVPLAGENFDGDSENIIVPDASEEELRAALVRLPELKTLTLTGSTFSLESQLALKERFPSVSFVWDVTLAGKTFVSDASALDFTGTPLTEDNLSEIGAALVLLPDAKSVTLTACGLSGDALRTFSAAHPEILTIWETQLFGVTFTTDAEEIEFTDIPLTVEDAAQIEDMLPYMPNLKKVVMLRCGISNEDMEEINLRHEDVQFVWMVQVYAYGVRTDQTYFSIYNCEYFYGEYDHLADDLRYCHDMIAVDLGHMHLYGDTYFLTQMPHLQYLILSSAGPNPIPELGTLKELRFLELGKASFTDITMLSECTSLTDIDLMYKRVKSDEVAEADVQTLCKMTWLKRLYLGGNMYNEEQMQRLYDSLPNTQIVIHNSPEWEQNRWREAEIYFEMRDALHMYYIDDDGNHVPYNPYTGEPSQYDDTDPFRKH